MLPYLLPSNQKMFDLLQYFFYLVIPKYCHFLNVTQVPSAEVKDCFNRIPPEKCFCASCQDQVDSMAHILFSCPRYNSLHNQYIIPWADGLQNISEQRKLKILLSGKIKKCTRDLAIFIYALTNYLYWENQWQDICVAG